MDLDVIMDDKDDIDNSQSRKKKDLSIIEEQFNNVEKHIVTRYLGNLIKFLC